MFSTLENIRLRALALRSSVHNEQQLTAVELAAMNAKKTNEIIDVVNDLILAINELSKGSLALDYDESSETLTLRLIKEV